MDRTQQQDLADRLRRLHVRGEPLVLLNAWDAVTARAVEEAGFPAIATTSGGVAAAYGYPDGEAIPFEEMLEAVARIARAVSVPVTADMEAGYGREPVELARGVIEAGAVGLNFEDSWHGGASPLVQADVHAERIRTLKAASRAEGVDLVVNARVDTYLHRVGEPPGPLEETVRRAARYLDAGADCVFVIGVRDERSIAQLVREIDGPLNVLAGRGSPPIARLAELGVARVSIGSGAAKASVAVVRRIAAELRSAGTYASFTDEASSAVDFDAMFGG